MSEQQQISNSSDWLDAAAADEEPSRLSGIVFSLLCAIPIFSAVAFGAVDTWALGLLSVFTFLLAAFWLADAWLKKEFCFNSSVIQIPLAGLILIGIIQLLPLRSANIPSEVLSVPATDSLSIAPFATRLAVAQLLIYLVFFAAALAFVNNKKRLRKVVFVIIIFGSLMAFFGILQRLANTDAIYGLRPSPQALPFASFINQHHFAAFMEMTIGITLALIFGQATKKDKQILLIIAVVLMGIAILLTGSRGGLLSLLGVVGFLVTANLLGKTKNAESSGGEENQNNFRRNFAFITGGLALMLVLFGAVLLLGGDESLLRGIGLQANQLDISNGRSHFWQIALKIFIAYPIFGAGLDSFGTAFTGYDTWNGSLRVEQVHNDYLQILAEAGIMGFACVAGFIFLLFKQSLQIIGTASDNFRRSAAIGALAGCFGVLVHSFFDFPLRTTANAFFFLMLVVIATASIYYPKSYRKERRSSA
ncbi:MAG TPA: O-antigen ligase family protein [Pyrinomonadaceae bacterium]|nr:O-antigen ligase family protein [Pyrinomonadaceae bacterium]